MSLSKEDRERILKARVKTSNPKQLKFLRTDTERKLKRGWVSQEWRDYVFDQIDKVLKPLGS